MFNRQMRGARLREKNRLVLTAHAVWAGTHLTAEGLNGWAERVLNPPAPAEPLSPEALDAVLAQQSRGMTVISMAEALARMGKP